MELGKRVKDVKVLLDSLIAIFWIINNSDHLSTFVYNRVKNIRSNIDVIKELYHVAGKHNLSDIGTKFKRIPDINNPDRMTKEKMLTAEDVAPNSLFHLGPTF